MDKKPLEVSPVAEGVIPVDEWTPEIEDVFATYAGKSVVMPFSKRLDGLHSDYLDVFYVLYKDSYVKKFAQITRYINYFIKFYDPDDELIMNYFHCKYIIDAKVTKPTRKAIIRMIYKHFVTPTMYQKVKAFVHDNYRIDLAQNKEAGKEYSEALEFTNDHAEILMLISTFIKFLIPLVMHYISLCKSKAEVKNLIKYYIPLFDLTYQNEGVNLYQKLYHSIMVKVNFNETNNPVIWAKYEATSVDAISYAEELLNKNLIVDNVFKYNFSQSIISFNSVILKTQLEYHNIKNFGFNTQEISTEKDSDGLSYLDKLEMDTVKIDENNILLNKVNIKDTIKRLRKHNRIKISHEEVDFYMDHMKINKISKELVFNYYAKLFGGFTALNNVTKKYYIKLMIIMKNNLELQGYIYLPQIISANIVGKSINRSGHNLKQKERMMSTSTYRNLMKEKYPSFQLEDEEELTPEQKKKRKPNKIDDLFEKIQTKIFGFVDYREPGNLNRPMAFDDDILKQEYQSFINSI